ncbi:hypothetical protein, partial [Mesorhizobium sp. M0870]|uniref:hypothetical protein n=1 Tax=Mesorhizobium sp. M0870 TaxID=2957016 RepID=UPI003337FC93
LLRKPGLAMGAIPRDQLVTTGSANPETTKKRTDIAAILHRKRTNSNFPSITLVFPNGIANLPAQSTPNCSRCSRTPVRDVSGPNRGEIGSFRAPLSLHGDWRKPR